MARARPARGAGIYSIAGPRWQDVRALVDQYLPTSERLRQLVPVLVVGFTLIASLGFYFQISSDKDAALTAARRQLALNADVASLKLSGEALASSADWQSQLANSLPFIATGDGRVVLLSDAEGGIQARAPIGSDYQGNLLTVLGPGQPLTIMGADAGVMREAERRHRCLGHGSQRARHDVQPTLIQPVGSALAGWRSKTLLEVTSPSAEGWSSSYSQARSGIRRRMASRTTRTRSTGTVRGPARLRGLALEPRARTRAMVHAHVCATRPRAVIRGRSLWHDRQTATPRRRSSHRARPGI